MNCSQGLHSYFQDNDFLHLHSPILTSNDCEGAGEMFRIAKIGWCRASCRRLSDGVLTVCSYGVTLSG
jgi:aspartyl/asparaginyl-tRNA synthetase